ncbi:immunoglobulin superfamily member 10-like [Clinocottus analis]|uniref:immunoglobulin superfamily member 10-like n=1 Tax=Clinocottus analis TaxID=304258 RepID=UPI0035BF780A
MDAVVGLLVMLLGVSHGVETHCDGRQDGAQCFGALGGTVFLQLMNNVSEIHRYRLLKETTVILDGRKNTILNDLIADRYFFTPNNGIFRINQLSRFDDGEYRLETYNSRGRLSERSLQLTIQAPVSSVRLVPECLSQGEMKVSCSSEGADSPQYSWTLDGKALTDSELLSGNTETNNITLKQHVSGQLVCSVRNNISSDLEERNISTCGVETHCDGRQDGAQCFGALGGTVFLQLMNNVSEIHRYQLLKEKTIILDGRKNTILNDLIADRYFFTPNNGTFRINQLSRFDDGEYRLETYNSLGRPSVRILQLSIQAPVSSVRLVPECLSQGEMKVSCSSEGADSPQYSWTLDGKALTDSELLSGNTETNNITLKQHVSGQLVCSVRNNISSDLEERNISTCGVETHCDGRQDRAQCYGALGGTVFLQLMNNVSEIHRYRLLKEKTIILDGRKNTILNDLIADRYFFTPNNGIFRINQLSRFDDGEYRLETYNSRGRLSERILQLTIQAPVSSVRLVPECLSQGEMKVSCSSEGADSPQYSWTLDGKALTDSELLSGNTETNNITLRQHVSGQLVCSVRNNISSDLEERNISNCVGADFSVLICGVRAAVVILALIGITVFFAWK